MRAFEAVIATHLPRVRRYARAFAASEADADDLAQEALVKVYKSLRSFRFQAAFTTWLYALVRNVFIDSARSRGGRERAVEEPFGPEHARALPAAETPDVSLAQQEERRRVWRALREVPTEFRSALVLFDLEGHTYDEVAEIEGVPVGTVKSRLSRGRAALREALLRVEGHPGTQEAPTSSQSSRSGG